MIVISCSLLPSGEEEKERSPLDPGSFDARLHNEKGFEDSIDGYSRWEAFVREDGSKAVYIALSPTKEARRWEGVINIVYAGIPEKGTYSVSEGRGLSGPLSVVYYRKKRNYGGVFSIESGELTIANYSGTHLKGTYHFELRGGSITVSLPMTIEGRFHAVRDTSFTLDRVIY